MQVRRNRAEFSRDVEKSDDQRRIDLLTELRDATVKLASERAKLEKIQEKLALAGVALPSRQDGSATPELTVHRRGQDELKAGFDLELQPGDVVEIVYRQSRWKAETLPQLLHHCVDWQCNRRLLRIDHGLASAIRLLIAARLPKIRDGLHSSWYPGRQGATGWSKKLREREGERARHDHRDVWARWSW